MFNVVQWGNVTSLGNMEKQDIGLRAQMFKELAQYVAPKRKAVEVSGPEGRELTLTDLICASYELEKTRPGRRLNDDTAQGPTQRAIRQPLRVSNAQPGSGL